MSGRSVPSDFVRSVLHNGVGRYVCQLQRLTLQFCKSRADSRGIRDFIESELVNFTRQHPGIAVYLQPRRHHAPCLVGEYLNGEVKRTSVANMPSSEVREWTWLMKNQSGIPIERLRKRWHTDNPSIQGMWHPFVNKPTQRALARFPSDALNASPTDSLPPSATDQLLQLANNLHQSPPHQTPPTKR